MAEVAIDSVHHVVDAQTADVERTKTADVEQTKTADVEKTKTADVEQTKVSASHGSKSPFDIWYRLCKVSNAAQIGQFHPWFMMLSYMYNCVINSFINKLP